MRIAVLTIFPEIFRGFLEASLIGKAISAEKISVTVIDIRDFADPPHHSVDDAPYGGGAGMVMRPEPLARAIESAQQQLPNARVILLAPTGTPFTQSRAITMSTIEELIIVCGRYEGIDQRVIELLVHEEISIGDYVVMGGEVPAMALIEAITRLIPGVIGNQASIVTESFSSNHESAILEAPHYTRPPEFRGVRVPDVLTSGDHAKIYKWREEQSRLRTKRLRPDLLR